MAVGPGKDAPVQVNVNDVVFFSKFAGTEIGESLVLMSEDDILAVEAKRVHGKSSDLREDARKQMLGHQSTARCCSGHLWTQRTKAIIESKFVHQNY